jgi:hypothetical protein
MFGQLNLQIFISLLMQLTYVVSFNIPRVPVSANRLGSSRGMSLDPLDVSTSINQISSHSTLEAIISTLYTSAIKLQPAHGHTQSLFGPLDPYLLKIQSIAPISNAGVETLGSPVWDESSVPESLRGAIDYARRGDFVDPTTVLRVDGAVPPGFTAPPTTIFSPLTNNYSGLPSSSSLDYQLGVLNAEVGNLRALQKIPLAAFLTVLVDFFLVTPGMDIFKEEIEENGDEINRESAVLGIARVVVLAGVAALTLALSG